MKINYYIAIHALITNKDRFHLITSKKNGAVLKYLKSVEYNDHDENAKLPDITQIVENVQMPRNKVYPIVYDLYVSLLESFTSIPKSIEECIQVFWIRRDDLPDDASKEFRERESKLHLWSEFKLPVTPRIGEKIRLNFIDHNLKYYNGVVTEIEHEIDCRSQRIIITVDPMNNYYHHWLKLKDDHLEHERWIREIRSRTN